MAKGNEIALPKAKGTTVQLHKAFVGRRSERDFSEAEISLQELAEVLFAAQGLTHSEAGYSMRTVPSAGALYPVDLYAAVNSVSGADAGVYLYKPEKHSLVLHRKGSVAEELAVACLGQSTVREAAVNFVYCYVPARIEFKYRERSLTYALIEAGASMQNAALACAALGLGTVVVGAFSEKEVSAVLGIDERPLAVQPVGKI